MALKQSLEKSASSLCRIEICFLITPSILGNLALHLVTNLILLYLNNIDETGKIKFTMQIADEVNGLEFLDLKIKCLKGKLSVDVYSKPTNSFTYVLPSTCYPMKNINKVPQGIALRLRRICDATEKYESRADEYKNYLLV